MAAFVLKSVAKSFSPVKKNCVLKIYRNYPALRKRFYRSVSVSESDGKYEICLDRRKLKTPSGSLLQLPNEALAVAVATEWDIQQEFIQQHNMHLTALCNTAVDNPCRESTEFVVDGMLQYLSSDTLCFRCLEPPNFAVLQKEKWDPILAWFENRYQVKIEVCQDIIGAPVSEKALNVIRKQILFYSHWCLLGINFAVENLKSLILTLAVIDHVIDVEQAVSLSRLETAFQAEQWGKIEWSHSVDEAQLRARVAAGALFTYLNEGSSDFIIKNMSRKVTMFGDA